MSTDTNEIKNRIYNMSKKELSKEKMLSLLYELRNINPIDSHIIADELLIAYIGDNEINKHI